MRTPKVRILLSIRHKVLPVVSVLSLMLPMLWSCNTEECLDNRNSMPYAGFYASAAGHQQIAIDSLTVFGLHAPGDSVLEDSATNISAVYLPFRISSESTSYVFKYNASYLSSDAFNDTVSFSYKLQPRFVSEACGAIYQYVMTGIDHTTHLIDSVVCPNGVIDNSPTENIKIYFRVRTDE